RYGRKPIGDASRLSSPMMYDSRPRGAAPVADVSVVDRARGMRDLVRSEAGESERLRTLSPVIVDAMWDCGLMSAFNPKAAGGVRLSGAWSFGSGTGHSAYIGAGFFPMDDGEMRWVGDGIPDMRVAFLPRDEVSFADGWHVQGLKGTGSYDYSVADVFVPESR